MPITDATLLDALRWRYATKLFDASRRIPDATWRTIEESLVLTPSSYGLQPWRFVVVTDPQVKSRLRVHSWNQSQVTDCSHLVVLAARERLGTADIDRFIERQMAVRGATRESLAGYRGFMVKDLVEGPRAQVIGEWAVRQAYIAFGQLMASAALLGVDACPLEGIVPAQYDAELGLPAKGYRTAAACALGYRAAGDKYASAPKVRYPLDEVIERR